MPATNQIRSKYANRLADVLIGRLSCLSSESAEIRILANLISTCDNIHFCGSGVCPHCNCRWQRRTSSAIQRFIQNYSHEPLYAVTIILPKFLLKPGDLHHFDIAAYKRSLRYHLDKAKCGLLFGVIEFDFVEHSAGRYPSGWLPHMHGLVAVSRLNALKAQLKSAIAATDAVPRPIVVKEWDGLDKWLSYCSKVSLKRRVGFETMHLYDAKSGKTRHCRNTKSRKLRSKELQEVARCLHLLPLSDRLFAYRAQWRVKDERWNLIHQRSTGNRRLLSIRPRTMRAS